MFHRKGKEDRDDVVSGKYIMVGMTLGERQGNVQNQAGEGEYGER